MSLFMDQQGIFFRTSINFTAVYSHHFFVTQRNAFQMLEPERQNGDVLFFEILINLVQIMLHLSSFSLLSIEEKLPFDHIIAKP